MVLGQRGRGGEWGGSAGLQTVARQAQLGGLPRLRGRGQRGPPRRGAAGPGRVPAATRGPGAAAAAAGAESAAAAGGLLGAEQHLRSHAPALKRSGPNRAPGDVTQPAAPPPRPAPSSLPGPRREGAGGAGAAALSAPRLCPSGAIPALRAARGSGTPLPSPPPPPRFSRVRAARSREPKGSCFRRVQTDPQGPKGAARLPKAHFREWST